MWYLKSLITGKKHQGIQEITRDMAVRQIHNAKSKNRIYMAMHLGRWV